MNGGLTPKALAKPRFKSMPAPFSMFARRGVVSRSSPTTVFPVKMTDTFSPRAAEDLPAPGVPVTGQIDSDGEETAEAFFSNTEDKARQAWFRDLHQCGRQK